MTKLLIVDDNQQDLYLLRVVLQSTGYQVETATNGVEALDKARRDPPDLIISDILMPVMDGFSLCREWKQDEQLAGIPFVFYTATYTDARDEELALSLGAERFIVKPQEPDAFVGILREAIAGHKAGRLAAPREPVENETVYLREYNQALIRKLEEKLVEVEQANRALEGEMAERRQAEAALWDREAELAAIVEHAPLVLMLIDADRLVRQVNGAVVQFASRPVEEMLGLHPGEALCCVQALLDPRGSGYGPACETCTLRRTVLDSFETGRSHHQVEATLTLARETGEEVRHLLVSTAPLTIADGQRVLISLQDVTERVQAEAELRRLKEFNESIVQTMVEGIALQDAEGLLTFVNPAAAALLGYTPEELVGQPWTLVVPPDQRAVVQAADERRRRGESDRYELELVGQDGSRLPVLVSASPHLDAESEGLAGTLAVFTDISARVQAEEERRRLSTAVEQAAEAVVVTDTGGHILYANPAFEGSSGIPLSEARGQHLDILRSERHDDAFFEALWQTLASGQVWQGRLINRKKDGSLYTVDSTITPVRDPSGEIVNYVATMRDVSRELELEEQFRQAQKMEALGRLAGGIAHDFNNLLTVILLSTRLLERQLRPEDPLWTHVQRIRETGQRAAELTKQMLSFSRREVVRPQVLNLNQVVGEMSSMLRRIIGEDIELVMALGDDLWPVLVASSQMEQVIMNLAVNARDAMPRGGALTVETNNVVLDKAYTALHVGVQPGEYVMLAISDAGVGMSPEVKARIFEPFFTTKERGRGTGLGLATVFGIVKQHGGHIRVYSEPGLGTTFRLYLPHAVDAEAVEAQRVPLVPAGPLLRGTETILVAEDEDDVRELMVGILQSHGYQVLAARDGPEAIQIGLHHDGPIHLLLTDMVLPQMHGPELAQQLQARRPQIKVLYISGYADSLVVQRGILATGVPFLPKPFGLETLARKVRAVLDTEE